MKLSIITFTYNSEKYLQECIDSVIFQNLNIDVYEHIFVDAYSTDKTKNIIEEYQKQYPNVKIIERQPKGVYNAMNEGIKKAKGEYILCLNSDDYLQKNILSKFLQFIKDTKEKDLYYGDIVFLIGDKQKNTKKYKIFKQILFRISGAQVLIFHPGVLIKRTTFFELGMFDESKKIASDYGFFLNILKNKKTYIYFPYITTYFREHSGGISSSKANQKINKYECEYFRNKYLPKYKQIIYVMIRYFYKKINYFLKII